MLLYYITDRRQFEGSPAEQRRQLLERLSLAAKCGVDYIQLREKDLCARELQLLAGEALKAIRAQNTSTRLLINSRLDVALSIGADGVHLTGTDMNASDARAVVAIARSTCASGNQPFVISVACHSVEQVRLAESHGADLAVLAPIFEKPGTAVTPLGLTTLRAAATRKSAADKKIEAGDSHHEFPVVALGGITLENAEDCLRAGAAGVAGIRLFQKGELEQTVGAFRKLES